MDDSAGLEGMQENLEYRKPFASFGSYHQRHAAGNIVNNDTLAHGKLGISSEAPAKLASHLSKGSNKSSPLRKESCDESFDQKNSEPIKMIPENQKFGTMSVKKGSRKAKIRSKVDDLEEIWERRRHMHMSKEMSDAEFSKHRVPGRAVGRSVSDCGVRRSLPLYSQTSYGLSGFSRATSLTDDDLDELRGCIDLGFAFQNNETERELWNTLPALELCYAISQQLKCLDSPSASPPVSPALDRALSLDGGSTTEGSPSISPAPSFRISSPGDHPQQVKARIKHWAQAVACTVKQNL